MNDNRNVIWVAVGGVILVGLVAYFLSKPAGTPAASSAASTSSSATSSAASSANPIVTEGPLAPATPVLPPDPKPSADALPPTPEPGTTPGEAAIKAAPTDEATPPPPAGTVPAEVPAPSAPTPSQPAIPQVPER